MSIIEKFAAMKFKTPPKSVDNAEVSTTQKEAPEWKPMLEQYEQSTPELHRFISWLLRKGATIENSNNECHIRIEGNFLVEISALNLVIVKQPNDITDTEIADCPGALQ